MFASEIRIERAGLEETFLRLTGEDGGTAETTTATTTAIDPEVTNAAAAS